MIERVRTIAISDTHLPDGRTDAKALYAFLGATVPLVTCRVILAGDIGEGYFRRAERGVEACRELIDRIRHYGNHRLRIHVSPGNHDERVWNEWPFDGVQIAPLISISGEQHILAVHGHEWDEAGWFYRLLSCWGYRGWRGAGWISERIKRTGSKAGDKSLESYRIGARELSKRLPRGGVVLHGHTHRPGIWEHRGRTIIDLGSWVRREQQTYAVEDATGRWSLRFWSSS